MKPVDIGEIDGLTATQLIDRAKQFKSGNELVKTKHGTRTVREYFAPMFERYTHNYTVMELRKTIGAGIRDQLASEMNIEPSVDRYTTIAMMLAQIIVDPSEFVCVALELDGFNFAYLYILPAANGEFNTWYISLGDSLQSPSGEWRGLMCDTDAYSLIMTEYPAEIDELVGDLPIKRVPKIHLFHSTMLHGNIRDRISEYIDRMRYSEKMMALAWFVAHYEKKFTPLGPISDEFAKFAGKSSPHILATKSSIAHDLYKKLGSISRPIPKIIESHMRRVGQKLIYLSPDELDHQKDSSFQVWNEIATTEATIDLALNFICVGFATPACWFYVHDATASLFNLTGSRERIRLSETVRLTPADMRLDKILSDTAICMVNEHCGMTFARSIVGSRSPDIIAFGERYVFDVLYAALCLHKRLGKAHGDLHCNNVTIAGEPLEPGESQKVMYVIGDDTYVFDHHGQYGCVIDFSRVADLTSVNWLERAIDKYKLYFNEPTSVTAAAFDTRIYGAIDDASLMECVSRATTAFDLYEFAMTTRLARDKSRDEKSQAFDVALATIEKESRRILLDALDMNKSIAKEWPAHEVIKKIWRPTSTAPKAAELVGIYGLDNPMQYSARSLAALPPSITKSPIIRDPLDTPVDSYFHKTSVVIKARYSSQ